MYSLLFFFLFAGCYLLYNTSKKARLGRILPQLAVLAQDSRRTKGIAVLLFVVTWILLIRLQGFGSGTFAFGGYLMAIGSMLILLNPFQYIRWTHLLSVFVLAFFFETCIF